MEIQSFQEAYKIYQSGTKGEFEFITDIGRKYIIYTSPADLFFPVFRNQSKIFYIGFYPHRETNFFGDENKFDKKIMNTVINFLYAILEERNSVVMFNYSATGGLDKQRKLLFSIYYIRENRNRFHKMDIKLSGKDLMTLIFRRDNDNFVDLSTLTAKDLNM